MRKTENLQLPIYDTPEVDKFSLNDWNTANENLEESYVQTVAVQNEVGQARGSMTSLRDRLIEIESKIVALPGSGDGATFTPSVDPTGTLSWSNDKSLPNPSPVNIKGDKGDKGDRGDTGATGAAGASAGFGTPTATATVLAEGATPTVSIAQSGANTSKVFAFTFGIPRGATGQQGVKGDTGATGATPQFKIGTVTTLEAGSSATATLGGTAASPTLNLGIPKGADGSDTNVTALTARVDTAETNITNTSSEVTTARGGKANLNARLADIETKVLKAIGLASAWAKATFLNSHTGELNYSRNIIGETTIFGTVDALSLNTSICVLPAGFRPLIDQIIIASNTSDYSTNIRMTLKTDGTLIADYNGTAGDSIVIPSTTFRTRADM